MESISIIKGATTVKKEAEKVQRQKSFFFAQIPHAFIQCSVGCIRPCFINILFHVSNVINVNMSMSVV